MLRGCVHAANLAVDAGGHCVWCQDAGKQICRKLTQPPESAASLVALPLRTAVHVIPDFGETCVTRERPATRV